MCFRGEEWCCENHRKLIVRHAERMAAVPIIDAQGRMVDR